MTQVRILRVLEYIYETLEDAEHDKMRWGVPANGAFEGGVSAYHGREKVKAAPVLIRSAIIEHPFPKPELTEDRVNNTMAAVGAVVGEDTAGPQMWRPELPTSGAADVRQGDSGGQTEA